MPRRILLLAVAVVCGLALADFATAEDVDALLKEGARLTSSEIATLEAQLEDDPLDISVRTRLLGHYTDSTRYGEPTSERRASSLMLWLIHNQPKSDVLSALSMSFFHRYAQRNPDALVEAKRALLVHLEKEPDDLTLLDTTIDILGMADRTLAIALLQRAKSLDSSNPKWSSRLAIMYRYGTHRGSEGEKVEGARKALEEYERVFELSSQSLMAGQLRDASEVALEANELEKAREFAHLMLDDTRPGSPYYGDHYHYGNITLGRIALAEGDVQGAASYLLLAGSTPGSRQLEYSGPDTELAKDLLEAGERESVLRYLDQCTSFWKKGGDKLREWTILVRAGLIPTFRRY